MLICIFVSSGARAQLDSTQLKAWRFDITGGALFQQSLSRGTPAYRAPDYLQLRRPTEPELANLWGLRNNNLVTDSPPGHGPMYIRPHVWYNPVPSLELYASLAIDHRGASWGPYNTDNIAFIPRFHARYNDWIKFQRGDSILVFGKIGYFEDYRLSEGLTLYNVDVQGLQLGFQKGHFVFTTSRIGDLIRGYGLGIDGMTDYQLMLNGLNTFQWKMDLTVGLQNMIGFPETGGDQRIITFGNALYKSTTRIYYEFGYRPTEFSAARNVAVVVGTSGKRNINKLSFEWRAEYRYYGGGFNYQFCNEVATHFRDTERAAGSNFIGDSVYPMSFFGRPFSQWAVFTEYDKAWVQGTTLFGSVSREIGKRFRLFSDFDLNYICANGEKPFFYPFYNAGLKMNIDFRSFVSISMTNRTMNLDKHFTTYYLLDTPAFQFEFKRTL